MVYRNPKRFFEDSGLVDPGSAYHVNLTHVTNTKGQDMRAMVDAGRYFSIFAPRQSGKTTFFRDFCAQLATNLTYVPILLSFQDYKNLAADRFYSQFQKYLYIQLIDRLTLTACPQLKTVSSFLDSFNITDHIAVRELFETLNQLIQHKKIVIFIDEFDGIPRGELENFLTSLRELYQQYKGRTDKALYSVGLVGIRNITKLIVGGVSPFNIADQVKLPPFTLTNVRDLYGQYTAETGQPFTEEAVKQVYDQTAGQPWLVNRLGTLLTIDIKPRTPQAIDDHDVALAIERLLKEHNSHFDNLLEKARQHKETFVRIVFDGVTYNPDDQDQSWLEQYGLIGAKGDRARPANPIYRQRFLNAFFHEVKAVADVSYRGYYTDEGLLDMACVLSDFEEYIMQIGVNAFYFQGSPREKTGQFLLTAWLYQFVPPDQGQLRCELPTGLGRMDILLTYRGRKYIIETKLNHGRLEKTIARAADQVASRYLAPERMDEGYVVVYDPKTNVGALVDPQLREIGGRQVSVFVIGIGKPEKIR